MLNLNSTEGGPETASARGIQGLSGETQVTRRYRVRYDASGDLPEHEGIYTEDELKVVPKGSA